MVDPVKPRQATSVASSRPFAEPPRLLKVDPSKLELKLVPVAKGIVTTDWQLEVKLDGQVKGRVPFVDTDGSGGMMKLTAESRLQPHLQVIADAKNNGQPVLINLSLLEQYGREKATLSEQFTGQYGLVDRVRPNGSVVLLPPTTANYLDSRGLVTADAKDVKFELVHFIRDSGIAVYVKGELKGHVDLGDVSDSAARAYRMNPLERLLEKAQADGKAVVLNFNVNARYRDGLGAGLVQRPLEEFIQYEGLPLPRWVKPLATQTASPNARIANTTTGAARGCLTGLLAGRGLAEAPACPVGGYFGYPATATHD